jgi:RNA polymerase sporulation-specific sigma factor
LSEFEAQALVAYLNGQSYQEIAAAIGRPVKAIDNGLQRVKKKIARNLSNFEF